MAFEELIARTSDGVTLRIDRVRAEPRLGVVLCLHAMMTDGRYFGARRDDGFAADLARQGLEVFVADFRGHGRSTPPHAGIDDWTFDDLVERDLPAIVAAVAAAAECPPEDLVILGHSLGGLVATAALATGRIPPPRKLLLGATCVWLTGPDGPVGRRALMTAYRGVTALFGKAPVRAVRAGTADEASGYIEQLTGWARTGRWTNLRGDDYLATAAAIRSGVADGSSRPRSISGRSGVADGSSRPRSISGRSGVADGSSRPRSISATTPILAFVGAGDWMCTPDDARGFARRVAASAPTRVVGRAHGDPLDPDHFQLFTRPELTSLRKWLIATARA